MSAYPYPLLIQKMLLSGVSRAAGAEIVSDGLTRYGYPELLQRVRRLVGALHGLGVRQGDTVAMMDWDTHRYLESFFGIPTAGAVLQMVNVRMSPEQIIYTLNKTQAKVIFCNADFAPLLDAVLPKLDHAKQLICLDDASAGASNIWTGSYETLLKKASPDTPFDDFDENTRATVFFTTGTTGLPKGVYFSHRQLVLHTLSLLAGFALGGPNARFSADGTYMPITPMFHVHAWGFPYAATLGGMKQVYPGRYIPANLLRLIVEEKITLTHCVPTILRMLLDEPGSEDVDLSRLSMAIGGSALPYALAEQALHRGIDVYAGYGMSEACPIISIAAGGNIVDTSEANIRRRTMAGVAAPLMEMQIVGPDMAPLPHDGEAAGEIVLRGPWLTLGYLDDEGASETLWEGGWLHTGDVGKIDPRGRLSITDRLKDVIKTGGEWISSLDMENILSRHPQVSEVAVIGVPHPQWGECALPFIVSRTGSDIPMAELAELIDASIADGTLPSYAKLRDIRFVNEIPKTSVGKLDKKALRQMVG